MKANNVPRKDLARGLTILDRMNKGEDNVPIPLTYRKDVAILVVEDGFERMDWLGFERIVL